jgi:hypothetical protein
LLGGLEETLGEVLIEPVLPTEHQNIV